MKTMIVMAAALAAAPASSSQQALRYTPDGQRVDDTQEQVCRDRIEQVRAEQKLPRLERNTASPDEPLFYTALDYRVGGCGALVMRNGSSDIRPVPAVPRDRPLLMPAR